MLTAQDIMNQDVVTVTPKTSVEEAADIMSQENVSGLPVVQDGKLIGVVSEKDLIIKNKKLNSPGFINILDGVFLKNPRKFEEEFKKFIAVDVKDLMTEEVVQINLDTPLDEIASLMVDKDVNRLPVVEDDKLVGIVTRGDIVRNMAGE